MNQKRQDFFRYQREQQEDKSVIRAIDSSQDSADDEKLLINISTIAHIVKHIWPQCLNILLIFIVSLSLFPAVMANVLPTGNLLSDVYFSKVACFLFFNLFSMIGNYASDRLPKVPPRLLWIPVVARFAFIPAVLFCNYQPGLAGERSLPVLFHSDLLFMLLVALFGFTNGHLTSLAMMYAPKSIELKYQPTAGMIASFCLMLGILLGGNLAILFPIIVNRL